MTTVRQAVAVAAAVASGGLVVAGCGGGSPSGNAGSARPAAHGTTTIPYVAAKNARADVSTAGPCAQAGDGAWALHGTVVNPTATPRGFSIVVDYITSPGDTVLHTSIVTVPTVAAHRSAPWSADWSSGGSTALTCVIRQAQFR